MPRQFVGGLLAAALWVGSLSAAEKVEGKCKGVDPSKGTLTLTVDGKERPFTINDDTKIQVQDVRSYTLKGTVKERLQAPIFKEAEKKSFPVKIKIEEQGGKKVVLEVIVFTGRKEG